jgi:hypothetical protein
MADALADSARHVVRRGMPPRAHDLQDRQPCRRHPHPRGSQPPGFFIHCYHLIFIHCYHLLT